MIRSTGGVLWRDPTRGGAAVTCNETLILMGHATSGVILSTVRLAADLDYHVIVVEDGCADRDPDVHTLLMEKVFPRQATVVSAAEMVAALGA
jgi:nicotinamidase-related amidase